DYFQVFELFPFLSSRAPPYHDQVTRIPPHLPFNSFSSIFAFYLLNRDETSTMQKESAAKTSSTLFELRNVSKFYDNVKVVDNVSFQIPKGHWVGILGESGSGKSTILQIAARFLDAEEGTVWLDQQP